MSGIKLRTATPAEWARDVVARLPELLSDHDACELQASVFALSLAGAYPEDHRLVDVLTALAMEELRHFRRATRECRRLGAKIQTRRRNPYAAKLRSACQSSKEPERSVELLLAAAVIEVRSHERFALLTPYLPDIRLRRFYEELARAEERHGPAYEELARARGGASLVDATLERLLAVEEEAITQPTLRKEFTVHSPMPSREPVRTA